MLLVFTLLLSLAACSENNFESKYTAVEISRQIIDSQQDLNHLETLPMGNDEFSDFLYNYYNMEAEILEDGVICYPDGWDAREIVILRLKDGEDPSIVEDLLRQYIESRIASYQGYMPDQVILLEQSAEVEIHGQYVTLFVCDNPIEAANAFVNCFGSNTKAPIAP